jgi:hypothetical protein
LAVPAGSTVRVAETAVLGPLAFTKRAPTRFPPEAKPDILA